MDTVKESVPRAPSDGDDDDHEELSDEAKVERERIQRLQQKLRENELAGSGGADAERMQRERKNAKRREAALELLQTEISYVRSIMIVSSGFIKPLEKDGILSQTEISSIFSNIRVLLTFHKDFLKKLKERVKDQWDQSQCVGDIMLGLVPFLKMYQVYGMNHDHARETLSHATANNQRFAQFLKEGMDTRAFDGLTLAAYLIMPIQRIPRYQMLLQVLVQNTEPTHEDYATLTKALEEVERVARTINQAIEKEVSINTLLKIQTLVNTQVVIPTRRFIREGLMRTTCFEKSSAKKTRKKLEKLEAQAPVVSPDVSGSKRTKKKSSPSPRLDRKAHKEDIKYATLRRGSLASVPENNESSPPEGVPISLSDKKAAAQKFRSTSVSDLSALRAKNLVPNPSLLPEARIFLCNDILIVVNPKHKSKTVIPPLITTWAKTSDLFPRAFEIATLDHGTFLCFAADPAERDAWLQAIDGAIDVLNQQKDLKATREKYTLVQKDDVWTVLDAESAAEYLAANPQAGSISGATSSSSPTSNGSSTASTSSPAASSSSSAASTPSGEDRGARQMPPKGAALLARMGASTRSLPSMRNRSQSQTISLSTDKSGNLA